MAPPRNSLILGLCLLLAAGAALPLTAGAADGFHIAPETEIDTPERTVTVEGETYTVDSTGYVRQGEDLTVTVETPDVDRYEVVLYNSESQIEERTTATEDGTVSFATDGRPAGSYVVTVWVDGVRRAIQPVVVSGYDVTVDAPDGVTAGSSATVTASLSAVSDVPDDPAHVNVIVFNDTWDGQYAATESGGEYAADLPGTLAPGEYSVYVTAHSDNEVNGRNEVTGLSGASTITVTADGSETDTPTDAPPGDSGGDGNGDSSADEPTDAPTDTPDDGTPSTPDGTPSDPATSTSPTATTTPATVTSGTTPDEPTDGTSTTESNVIQPAETTDATTTETTAPGFPVLGFALLAVAAAWTQLRSRGRS